MARGLTVGVLTPLLSGHYFGGLLRGVARATASAGGKVVAVQTFDPGVDEIAYLDLSDFQLPVAWQHVAGFVVILNSADRRYLDALRDAGKPVVMVSQEVPGFDCPVVLPDNQRGAQLAVEHLIEHGHERIGFVGWMAQEDIRQRHQAYQETLAAHGIPYDPGLVFPADDNVTTGGEAAAELMLGAGMPATACFCANDYNAVGLIRGLTAAGRTLPRDLALVGFDDVTAAQHVVPNLSTIDSAFDDVGQEAGEVLLAMLAGREVPPGKRYAREGQSRLVTRESCGCPPQDAGGEPQRLAAENQYLERALNSQYGITMELLRSDGNPAALQWLEHSQATSGCLGLWMPDHHAEDPLLEIVGTYHRDPAVELKPDEPVPVSAFPPAELIEESDPGAGQIAVVVPVRLRDSDRGMLAHVGPIDTQKSSIVETVNQWAALLCGMLDHRAVVTSLREQEDQLRHAALYDRLTGLPNRTLFLERVGHALGRTGDGYRFGILFLDLDGLKVVNDSLGHLAGDRLLCQVAERISAEVRPVDTPARFAGDEFAVLVDGIGDADALTAVAERLQEAIGRPHRIAGQEVVVSVSIGIAEGTSQYQSAEDLLRNADIAMYRAKARKKGSHAVFDVSMRAEAIDRLRIETELRHAVAAGQLELHYQPIVDLATGGTVAVEALLRWQHPSRGLLSPAQFLPVAEEAGLMVPIGRWVVAEACRQLAGWRRDAVVSEDLWVSINLSDRQFWYGDAAAIVAASLEHERLPARCIALEITEGVVVHDVKAAQSMLQGLHDQGLKLYVDDFGTGYSSLSVLRELPIDALKIDKSFVSDVATSARARELVRTIISMGHNLGMGVIAEGIENPVQHALLRELGCELGQGHLFSRPVRRLSPTPRPER
ncbi:EAL domain-containing protein [Micromonospora sp. CPCC 206061]|uniref:EAL domain-containing protein n=1 Tax=Micromonospora sp. CPCC 206061 TaxID=3122410 RepID=UPI002FF43CA9